MCAGSTGRHRGGFPCGRWATLGDTEEEEEEEGESEKEEDEEEKKEEGEIPWVCLAQLSLGEIPKFCGWETLSHFAP